MNLAPVMDVNDNPTIRSLGYDHSGHRRACRPVGTAMIETYQSNGIIATAKHFPGHGNTAVDSHVGLAVVTGSTEPLDAVELRPSTAATAAGVGAIMTAHVVLPAIEPMEGLPATLSQDVLSGLLREQLGYEGLIVTDSLGMVRWEGSRRQRWLREQSWRSRSAGVRCGQGRAGGSRAAYEVCCGKYTGCGNTRTAGWLVRRILMASRSQDCWTGNLR